jgi:hypothetical protein
MFACPALLDRVRRTPEVKVVMKNPLEVLRIKEQELLKVKKEIDALRITVKLLGDETSAGGEQVDLRRLIEMP